MSLAIFPKSSLKSVPLQILAVPLRFLLPGDGSKLTPPSSQKIIKNQLFDANQAGAEKVILARCDARGLPPKCSGDQWIASAPCRRQSAGRGRPAAPAERPFVCARPATSPGRSVARHPGSLVDSHPEILSAGDEPVCVFFFLFLPLLLFF